MVSDTRSARGGGGYGLVFDRMYRIYRIEGEGRNAEGAEITRSAQRNVKKYRSL